MRQGYRTHPTGTILQRSTSAFFILFLFTLSSFVNQSEAGWIHTEGEDFSIEFIHWLQQGDIEQINKHLEPGLLLTQENQVAVKNAVEMFPQANIKKITRLQLNVNYGLNNEGRTEEYQFFVLMDHTALLMDTVLQEKDGQWVVQGFHFNKAPMNLMRKFPFYLISWIQPKNVFMAVAGLNILLIMGALALLFIRPVKAKLLWLPVAFAGIMKASAQWLDDGPWSFEPLAIRYPSIWFSEAVGQDPWSIVVSVPLGAAVVLFIALISKSEPDEPPMRMAPRPRMQPRQPQQRKPRSQPVSAGK